MSSVCNLADRHCVPCEGGVPTMERVEIDALLADLDGWTLSENGEMISKRFEFRGFFRTMSFINAMAFMTEQQGHHPDFSAGYNYCKVLYTTHAIGGLSENDFICAAKINDLLES